ncbi:hypothetical protein I4F81_003250 [Pyropia yezoensis]|uniref:Uncharacterized protein n=1 Tax=Pyropia yezoensis TaxID=2788 RepID=A0ACC3BS41_PYRYE|nr:hypothetical protein I4F81_003250 [Neopyropia yezoensis]|eukprot:contig_13170_g3132
MADDAAEAASQVLGAMALDNNIAVATSPSASDPGAGVASASSSAAAVDASLSTTSVGPPAARATHVLETRLARILSVGERCIEESELRALLTHTSATGRRPLCYDGFEPSGRMHIAQGIQKAVNVNKLTSSGCDFVFWVADWFAALNDKLGGDLKKIRVVGEYFIEVWKASGMDMDHVRFMWASDSINAAPDEYWRRVMDVARLNSLARIKRCGPIMGRQENDNLSAAQVLYPCMQAADVFFLKADICQLGTDQLKVNMLAREYCDATRPKISHKPVVLSHVMLPGLKAGQDKMSKSDPESALWMEDTAADVNSKIKKAFCPEKEVKGNPCLAYVRHLVIPAAGSLTILRKEANGGNVTYSDADVLEAAFAAGDLHPGDLKPALSKAINALLQPVRDHFTNNPKAKALLKQVKSYKVTRSVARAPDAEATSGSA